jgi:hypothetical protein
VQFQQGASDCESQPQAVVAARDGGIGLAEALEHFRDKLRRDSFAAILNSDLELGFVGCASQADCAAVRRELDRVAQEIVENLFQPIFEPSTLPDSASSALSSRRFSRAAGIAAWTAHCATRVGLSSRCSIWISPLTRLEISSKSLTSLACLATARSIASRACSNCGRSTHAG